MGIEQLAANNQTAVEVKPAAPRLVRAPEQAQDRPERAPMAAATPSAGDAPTEASSMEFSLDAESGRVVVKIIDSATQEVVRQIPMEEMLDLAKALDKFQGLLLHTKA